MQTLIDFVSVEAKGPPLLLLERKDSFEDKFRLSTIEEITPEDEIFDIEDYSARCRLEIIIDQYWHILFSVYKAGKRYFIIRGIPEDVYHYVTNSEQVTYNDTTIGSGYNLLDDKTLDLMLFVWM